MITEEGYSVPLKLSICIATHNRAAFIGATLNSLVCQMSEDCEVVVLDGASSDDTGAVVASYASQCERLRYIRQSVNNGIDRDYNRAVELAEGEFCWLMTDDDILKPRAVRTVLEALSEHVSLVVVNAEDKDLAMSKVQQSRWLPFLENRTYASTEMDRLFVELGDALTYIGCVVIRRKVWIRREKARFIGTGFLYFGVIFQEELPGSAILISEPLISYRRGNMHTWSAQRSEIIWNRWPALFTSLAITDGARKKIRSTEPWSSPSRMLLLRAAGLYSRVEYDRWVRIRLSSNVAKWGAKAIALWPGSMINALLMLYYSLSWHQYRGVILYVMRESPFYIGKMIRLSSSRIEKKA